MNQRPFPHLGPMYAILAYGAWGLFPVYWKQFGDIPALEILSHRMIWSLLLLLGLLAVLRRGTELRVVFRSRRSTMRLLMSATLLALNWGTYIYGVNHDRILETSLGYFINPLVTVLLGLIFLGERLGRWQQVAVAIAAAGVGWFTLSVGQVPWLALILAFSFAFYGLLRKLVPVAPMTGLAVETLLITPVALAYVLHMQYSGSGHFGASPRLTLLFIGCGVATSLPLLWFNNAAKRLRLATLGFFQYLAPSLQFLLGIFLYREPLDSNLLVLFGFIWTALVIYSVSSWTKRVSAEA